VVLIEAMSTLISGFGTEEDWRRGIERILRKQRGHLAHLLKRAKAGHFGDAPQPKDVSADGLSLYDTVNNISQVFKYFSPRSEGGEHIAVSLLEDFWPNIGYILTEYTECDGVMEKTTRIIKHVIRNGGASAFMESALCIEALELLTDLYCSRSQRSSFLYIVWIYVDEYMANNAAAKALMDTLGKFTRCTFEGPLRDEKAFAVHYDIAEDFYELIVQYIRKAHCQLIQRPLFVRTLWERAICGLLLDHDKALDAITAFFTECIAMASYDETHRELVDQLLFGGPQFYGRRIIHQILRGFCGKVRRERAVTLGNLLDAMLKYNAQQTEQLTRQLVAEEISLKSQDPTKEEFVDEYFDSRNDSRFRMRYILEWFDANDRYLRSTTF